MILGQGGKAPLQVGIGLVGQHPVNGPEGTLPDRQQVLCPGGGLENKGLHKAPGFARAGSAVNHGTDLSGVVFLAILGKMV